MHKGKWLEGARGVWKSRGDTPFAWKKEREISNRTLDLLPAWLDTGFEMDWSALSVLSNITE